MNSTNKRKEAVTSKEKPVTKKKFSQGRKRWNKRLKLEHKQNDQESEDNDVFPITETNIVFNSLKVAQYFGNAPYPICYPGLSNLDKVYNLEKEWTSVPISSWDRVSTKENKILVDISSRDILIEALIREARSGDTDYLGLTEIPPDFLS
ncbi:1826_t:CDS:2, partial [Paraglomus brasilianum]